MANGALKNVAIESDLHQRVRIAAATLGETIAEFTARALNAALPPANRKKTGKAAK